MNKVRKIEVKRDKSGEIVDVDFYFVGSKESFSEFEFPKGTKTRDIIDVIMNAIVRMDMKYTPEKKKNGKKRSTRVNKEPSQK